MKRLITFGVAMLATLAFAAAAAVGAPPSSHGPYSITSTDNGSCSTPWATDTLSRTWEVKKGPASGGHPTWRVTRIDQGTFTTLDAASPGSCESGGGHGTHIAAGRTGKVHGRISGTVTGGTYNPMATCPADCTTTAFISAFFGPSAHYTCIDGYAGCSFEFNYSAKPNENQGLLYNHWTDKDNGGTGEIFIGDIATS